MLDPRSLSIRDLYIILSLYHRRPLDRARLLWSVEDEEIASLEKYVKYLDDPDIRLSIIENLMAKGLSLDKIVEAMDWRGFESLVSEFFRSYGYKIYRNYRLKRNEYDVIAVKEDHLISIDCKHWDKPLPPSKAREVAENLRLRSKKLYRDPLFRGRKIYMAIVTLRESRISFINGVAIIPITYIRNFLEELYSLIYQGYMKEASEP